VGLKVKGKEVDKCFGNVEQKVINIYGASNTLPKKQNSSNPKIKTLPLTNEENELHKLLFLVFFSFFTLFPFFWVCVFLFFSLFFLFLIIKKKH